jgi:hypothetical protein
MSLIYESIPATTTVDANRNNFMASNDIVARVKGLKVSAGNADGLVFDHCHLYKNKHGRLVLINSLYAPNVEDLHQMGFEETDPLYTEEAQTFLKEFDSRAEANDFIQKPRLRSVMR